MNTKTLAILGGALLVVGAVAVYALNRSETSAQTARSETRLFPELSKRVNDVAEISVKRQEREYKLRRTGEGWGLPEKGDYPVLMEKVRKAILAVAEMKIVEPKTSDPARYALLGVEDLDAPEAKSKVLTLSDKDGKELAKLIIGKDQDVKGAVLSKHLYVRRGGEAQSYLVSGTLELAENETDWVEKKFLEVKRDRISSVEITQPDGEKLVATRESKDVQDFKLDDLPADKELTYPSAPSALGGALEYLSLEDVLPAGQIDFSKDAGPVARFKTFDGLVVSVTTKDQDGKTYAKFEASYEAPPQAPAAPPTSEEKPAEGEAPATPATPPATAQRTPEEVQKEADTLNARLMNWTYAIPAYSKTNFTKKKAELYKDKTPPPPPQDPTAPDGTTPPDEDALKDLPKEIQDQIREHQQSLGNDPVSEPKKDAPKQDEPPATPPH
jgi:hypothetical protein